MLHPDSPAIRFACRIAVLCAALLLGTACGKDQPLTITPAVSSSPLPTPQIAQSPLATEAPPPQPLTGRILYHANENEGRYHIGVMRADGSSVRQLTDSAGDDVEAAWSPDGQRIAFGSDRDGNFEIYVMDADGANQRRLTTNPAMDWGPSWSRDGLRILFTSNRGGQMQLFAMNADGSDQSPLLGGDAGLGWAPQVSPTRDEIVFVSERTESSELYLADMASKEIRRLTFNDLPDERPVWSPDGEQILYMGSKEVTMLFDPDELWAISREGGEPRQLTDNLVGDITPTWSPDGRWIAFASTRDGGWALYAMPATGGEARRLTQGSMAYRMPRWGP